jgi:hypothetical protein
MAAPDFRKARDLGRFCLTMTSSNVFSLSIADRSQGLVRQGQFPGRDKPSKYWYFPPQKTLSQIKSGLRWAWINRSNFAPHLLRRGPNTAPRLGRLRMGWQ